MAKVVRRLGFGMVNVISDDEEKVRRIAQFFECTHFVLIKDGFYQITFREKSKCEQFIYSI